MPNHTSTNHAKLLLFRTYKNEQMLQHYLDILFSSLVSTRGLFHTKQKIVFERKDTKFLKAAYNSFFPCISFGIFISILNSLSLFGWPVFLLSRHRFSKTWPTSQCKAAVIFRLFSDFSDGGFSCIWWISKAFSIFLIRDFKPEKMRALNVTYCPFFFFLLT